LPLSDDHTVAGGDMAVGHCQMISQNGHLQSHHGRPSFDFVPNDWKVFDVRQTEVMSALGN